MKNKLLKTAASLLASVLFAGAFAFMTPTTKVRADDINWKYYTEVIGGKTWVYVTDDLLAKVCGSTTDITLPDPDLFPAEVFTDGHLYIRLESTITVNKTLDYSAKTTTPKPVTIDLCGSHIVMNKEATMLNLAQSASYEFINTALETSNINTGVSYSGYFPVNKGGLFNVGGGSTLTIDNVNLWEGYAKYGGAVYAGSGSTVNISNSIISECIAQHDGYGIYADAFSNVTLTNVDVSENYTVEGNGAVYNASSNLTLKGKMGISYNDYKGTDLYIADGCPVYVASNAAETDVNVTYETPAVGTQVLLPASGVSLDGYHYSDAVNFSIQSNGKLAKSNTDVTLKGYKVVLNSTDFSKIAIKFKFHVPTSLRIDDLAFYFNDKVNNIFSGYDENNDLEVTYYVDYLQIADPIDISVRMYEDDTEYFVKPSTEISVKAYAKAILTSSGNEYTDTEKTVIIGMLNYGTYMAAFFGKTGEAPNSILTAEQKAQAFCSNSVYEAIKQTGTTPAAGEQISFYGASLATKPAGELNSILYFKLANGVKLSDLTYELTVGTAGRSLRPNSNPKFVYVDIPDITAYNLDKTYEISLTGLDTFTYCPLDYVYLVYHYYEDNTTLYNYVKALYAYHLIVKGAMTNA